MADKVIDGRTVKLRIVNAGGAGRSTHVWLGDMELVGMVTGITVDFPVDGPVTASLSILARNVEIDTDALAYINAQAVRPPTIVAPAADPETCAHCHIALGQPRWAATGRAGSYCSEYCLSKGVRDDG